MKGKKCIKYLILCIICLLSLSHYLDANAVTFTVDLQPENNIKVDGFYCKLKNNTTVYGCGGGAPTTDFQGGTTYEIQNFYTQSSYEIKKDYYYEIYFSLLDLKNATYYSQPAGIIWQIHDNDNFAFVTIEQVIDETNTSLMQSGSNTYFQGYNSQNVTFRVLLRALRDGTVPFKVGNDTSTLIYQDTLHYQRIYVYPTVNEYKLKTDGAEEMNEKDDQDRQDIEQQSSSTEDSADTASEDVGGATTNIIGAINGFATAVTNIQAGTCILPEISAYGMNLGRLNLCTYSPPAWVQGLTSTILSLITLKMAISIFYRIMGLLDGVLGGKK